MRRGFLINAAPKATTSRATGAAAATGPVGEGAADGTADVVTWAHAFIRGRTPAGAPTVASPVRPWSELDTAWLGNLINAAPNVVDARHPDVLAQMSSLWAQNLVDPSTSSGFAFRAPDSDLLRISREALYTDPVLRAGVTLAYWEMVNRHGWACFPDRRGGLGMQGVLSDPCEWCGEPTGLQCDQCDVRRLCSTCEGHGWVRCRNCSMAGSSDHPITFFCTRATYSPRRG
jgi:hypothetical protein